ncbi:ArsR/SmtB family transcription factor [Flavihumibacter petaseus]|uniref:Putative ArsR family transcriptional regulator n=1 Tax=Flavihumibacter petaseus NBRC 106054 TaxID=1220578 RepID=A0A0E9MU81_9BACT|nr:metalloregulator ArsR/SmtB family transcription factor [Flavihumibacter petaseus]GAO41033.1 putative ArsR family transcriptional regulator [Flavihumibacter petaseus NBRC 106054]
MTVAARRDVFQAIADPTRRNIIGLIAKKPMNLNSIAGEFDISRPAISQHIKILTECGLVIIRQEGRERYCEVQLEPLGAVADWLEPLRELWEHRFGKLDHLLGNMHASYKNKKKKK